jgi:quercetin dioxygenase-like cupin family protein
MSEPPPRFTVVRVADRQPYWVGGQRQALIVGGPQTADRYALSHSAIAVGGGANEHRHGREAEAFYVLEGKVRFSLEGQPVILEKGDFLHAEPGLKYSFEVLGPTPGQVLILYAPAGLERFIAEAGIPDPADEAQSRQAAARSIADARALMLGAAAYDVRYTAVEDPDAVRQADAS